MAFKEKKQPEKRDDTAKSEIMHRLKTHPFLFIGTVIILVIVIVAFVFVPAIVPNVQSGLDPVFGYYNKVPIKYVQDNYFNQVLQGLSQNQQPSPEDPNYFYTVAMMWRQAFEETAVYLGILDEMKQAGYQAPENVVDREVAELSTFQENGRFSVAKYRALDNNSRLKIWRETQESIAIQNYLSDMTGLRTASGEISFIGTMAAPQRRFDLTSFSAASYPDSEIRAYAAANPALFQVTRLSIITINSSEREARQILESVKAGTSTFEEAARTNSQDAYAEKSGDMGIKMAYELVYEITEEADRERVINLAKGDLSDLVKVPAGWAFFRAEETARAVDMNDTTQAGNVRGYIMSNERGRVEDWLVGEAEKFTAQARVSGFEAAISSAGLTKQTFGPISVNYGNAAPFSNVTSSGIPELYNAGTNELFWKTAFTTPLNSPSVPLVLGDYVVVLFPLEESVLEESEIEAIRDYSRYWVSSGAESSFRSFFLNNEKMDDRFEETFWKLWS